MNGSRPGFASKYISATHDLGVAQKWAAMTGNQIASIDLNTVDSPVLDLSTAAGRATYLSGVTARNNAAGSREVLIVGRVPAGALFEP